MLRKVARARFLAVALGPGGSWDVEPEVCMLSAGMRLFRLKFPIPADDIQPHTHVAR